MEQPTCKNCNATRVFNIRRGFRGLGIIVIALGVAGWFFISEIAGYAAGAIGLLLIVNGYRYQTDCWRCAECLEDFTLTEQG